MSTFLPAVFGENMMDLFDDFDRDFFRGFARPERMLYGKNAARMIDALISPDGRTGELRDLFEAGEPLIFITHWQSLFSDGRGIGMEGFEFLLQRIEKVFGKQVEWASFGELAARA